MTAPVMTGEELRRAYFEQGFSRRSFAKHCGVLEQSLRRLEGGERIHPANAKKIADALELKVTDLMSLPEDVAA